MKDPVVDSDMMWVASSFPRCGNGVVDPQEECDEDADSGVAGSGCSALCQLPPNSAATVPTASPLVAVFVAVCALLLLVVV